VPRYLVERTFAGDRGLPSPQDNLLRHRRHIEDNALDGVTWVHSYVALDRRKSYCICDAPTPEAVRRAAGRSGLPVDRITEVRVLDPYGLP
jgi:hypothetical protein